MARTVASSGAVKRRAASPALEIAHTSLPEATKTIDAAPRTPSRSVNEAGVATGAVVGRSAGGGDDAATVGGRVGLGSVANCGPVSSSAQATSIRLATSAERYAGQLSRERLISTSQMIEQVHPIAESRDRRLQDR